MRPRSFVRRTAAGRADLRPVPHGRPGETSAPAFRRPTGRCFWTKRTAEHRCRSPSCSGGLGRLELVDLDARGPAKPQRTLFVKTQAKSRRLDAAIRDTPRRGRPLVWICGERLPCVGLVLSQTPKGADFSRNQEPVVADGKELEIRVLPVGAPHQRVDV